MCCNAIRDVVLSLKKTVLFPKEEFLVNVEFYFSYFRKDKVLK